MTHGKIIWLLLAIVISLLIVSCIEKRPEKSQKPEIIQELVLIPGGMFIMGDESEGDHNPPHEVMLDSF